MNENITVKSPKPSINRALQAALGSLDVQLEEELSRYRRQKAARPLNYHRISSSSSLRKPVELISINPGGEGIESTTINIHETIPILLSDRTSGSNPPPNTVGTEITNPSIAGEKTNILAFPSSKQTESQEATTTTTIPPQNSNTQSQQQDIDSFPSPPPPQPEEYLESSEKLKRSIAESQPESQPKVKSKKRFGNKIFTPVGVGSILLLLLSSATLIYILINPNTRSNLSISSTTINPPTPKPPTTNNNEPAKASNIGPDLASDEFTKVNFHNLSHLEANPKPKTIPSPVKPIENQVIKDVTQPPSLSIEEVPPGNSSNLPAAILNPPLPPGGIPPVAQPSVTAQPKSTTQPKPKTQPKSTSQPKSTQP